MIVRCSSSWSHATSLLLVLVVASLFASSVGQADPPEYTAYWKRLFDIGQKQARDYLWASFVMPLVSNNPSITPWIFDEDPAHPNYLISWCSSVYSCAYYVASVNYDHKSKELQFKTVKGMDSFEYFDDHEGKNRKPLFEFRGDIRLYQVDTNKTKFTYNEFRGKFQDTFIADLHYHKGLDALYVINHPSKVNIISEYGGISQKNWSPFIFHHSHLLGDHHAQHHVNGTSSDGLGTMRRLSEALGHRARGAELFVYSIHPHRVVHSNETDGTDTVFHTLCSSAVKLPAGQTDFWRYGEPRGGTPSVLVHTVHGPRYLTFFHSQGNFAVPYILTYYMGAYLFEASPPFAITHMTVDPIVPTELYSEKHGWAFKAIDYIVFPTGLVVREGLAYVTVGRNDRSGWMLAMNVSGLVGSLTAVSSETLSNSFHSHFKRIHEHAVGHQTSTTMKKETR